MSFQVINNIFQPVDGDGNTLPSATLEFYVKGGTSTPQDVYSDAALSVSLGNTITADGDGKFTTMYINADYTYVLKDKNGVIIEQRDYAGPLGANSVSTTSIQDNAVTLAKIQLLDDAKFIVGVSGTTNNQVAFSGDATVANTGVITLTTDSVVTANITDANVTAAKLATDAVETAKIKDLNVTEGKLSAAVQAKLTGGNGNATDIYLGRVLSSATPSFTINPGSWTVTNPSGAYITVTHNLGTTNYAVTVTPDDTGNGPHGVANITSHTSNSFQVSICTSNSVTHGYYNFNFVLVTT